MIHSSLKGKKSKNHGFPWVEGERTRERETDVYSHIRGVQLFKVNIDIAIDLGTVYICTIFVYLCITRYDIQTPHRNDNRIYQYYTSGVWRREGTKRHSIMILINRKLKIVNG